MVKLHRRLMIGGMAAGLTSLVLPLGLSWGQEETEIDQVQIRWRVPREEVEDLRERLAFEGETIPDETTIDGTRGLPAIYILVGAVALALLSSSLVDGYRDVKYGGIIIDARGEELLIKSEVSFPSDKIVIVAPDGELQVHQADDSVDFGELVRAVLGRPE